MNKNRMVKKAAVVGLSMALAVGQTAPAVSMAAAAKESKNKNNNETSELSKQESVYVNLDATGKASDITVTDWIKNVGIMSSFNDISELSEISNIKGEEKFKQNGNNLVWDADNKDIYYQGKINKELPVTMKITYKLDGKTIQPKNLVGKSGRLGMTFQYTNNVKETVKVGNKKETVNVPFAMITGAILPVEHFSNVDIDNGKIMSDADRTMVVGLALPGLEDSLDLSDKMKDDIDIPSSITVTADVKDFEMGPTFTLATSELLNDFDSSDIESVNKLKDSMDDLKDASKKLVDGSKELADGVGTLKSKSGEFSDGIDTLNNGIGKISSGAGTLENGIKDYTNGANTLSGGISKLAEAVKQLPSKFTELSGGINSAKDGADKLVTNTEKLQAGMKSVNGGIDTVHGALSQIQSGMSNVSGALTQSGEAMKKSIEADTTLLKTLEATLGSLPEEQQAVVQEQMKALQVNIATQTEILKQLSGSDTSKQLKLADIAISQLVKATGKGGELKDGASAVENGIGQVQDGQKSLQSGLGQIKGGVDALTGSKSQLNELTSAVEQLNAGGKKLSQNSNTLVSGAGELKSATSQLATGGNKLSDGKNKLISGIDELADGSKELKDGMEEFDKDGITKLYDIVNEDLDKMLNRLDAISSAGSKYKSFAGIDKDMTGTVKFIMETEEIKK